MKLTILTTAFLCLQFSNAWSATITVLNLNNAGGGSLRNAISNSNSGDIIDLTGLAGTITLTSGQLDCSGKNLTFNGPGAAILSISGNNTSRIFYVSNADIELDGLTLTNGSDNSNVFSGGAALASYEIGDVTISNCIIINNSSNSSYSRGGAVDIANYNPVNWAGGTTAKKVEISYCQFENNQSYIGGALVYRTYSTGGSSFSVSNTTFKDNHTLPTAANDGGAFECAAINNDNIDFTNCTFSGNSSVSTGGNNKSGGALSLGNGNVTINSCTIVNNSSGSNGGGVIHWGGGNCTVTNTIIANNTAVSSGTNVNGSFISGGFNLIGNNGAGNGFNAGTDLNSTNPQLAALANNGGFGETHAFVCASPAIDAGGSNPALDQRDLPRVCDPDIGAFEYQIPCNCDPLPIELLYFNAVVENRSVKLDWVTLSEKDNDYFVVQRSKDGVKWEDVLTQDGAGTTSETITYEDYDFSPLSNTSYYRLNQFDFDGTQSTSTAIAVNLNDESEITINPTIYSADPQLNINTSIDWNAQLIISDNFGRMVIQEHIEIYKGSTSYPRLWHHLVVGTYYLTLVDVESGKSHKQKLVVL
jgi:hypothetical protein